MTSSFLKVILTLGPTALRNTLTTEELPKLLPVWEEILPKLVEHDYPNPCGRIAERREVADLVAFIASPRAGFINGQNIRIDGGAVVYV